MHGDDLPGLAAQTLRDVEVLRDVRPEDAPAHSSAEGFLWVRGGQALRPTALEECFWGLQAADWVTWRDTGLAPPPSLLRFAGPIGVSRAAMERLERKSGRVRELPWPCRERDLAAAPEAIAEPVRALGGRVEQSQVLEPSAWRERPVSMLSRLIPLRWKEAVNRRAGRPLFDLTYYLQFQPSSAVVDGQILRRREYGTPAAQAGKRRIAVVIPTFESGGAEAVLLEILSQIDRAQWEVLVFVTQSKSNRWRARWVSLADQWFDLSALMPFERVPEALYSMALNWGVEVWFVQNALAGYTVLPALKQQRSSLVAADLNHNVDSNWDFFAATLDVAEHIDLRGVISEQGRRRLYDLGTPAEDIRVLPNGVDVGRFRPRTKREERVPTIAFVGALVERKQPLLLAPIVNQVREQPGLEKVRCLVAGDGPLLAELRRRIANLGLRDHFRLYGFVEDVRQVLGESDVLVMPSVEEGVPLAILEAYAMQVPVVAADSGAMGECVSEDTGLLVEPGSYAEDRFAAVIGELLRDRPRLSAMGLAARAWVTSERTREQARERYRGLLDELRALADH